MARKVEICFSFKAEKLHQGSKNFLSALTMASVELAAS